MRAIDAYALCQSDRSGPLTPDLASETHGSTPPSTPRKYCSAACRTRSRSRALAPYHLDLARAFHALLSERPAGAVILCSEVEAAVAPLKEGAEHREEARRTARRLVNFGFAAQGVDEKRAVEGVQDGKVVEASYAKGEWGVRWAA
jgi:hypothetical protein